MYFEFLFRRAHSRSLVDRTYWSGVNLYSFTTCSNDVTVGVTGPIGSGLPQFGFPRRFAILLFPSFVPNSTYSSRRKKDGKPHSHSRVVNQENQVRSQLQKPPPRHPPVAIHVSPVTLYDP